MKTIFTLLTLVLVNHTALGQYVFEGYVDKDKWQGKVCLSLIDNYRTMDGIHNDHIIAQAIPDSTGRFLFKGNQLDHKLRIYKLHVDNCESESQNLNHFNGECPDYKTILFLAKNTDTITFPLSLDAEMFCNIVSNNPKTSALVKIDSLKEEMKFAYAQQYPSASNTTLNHKKWFKILQDFGQSLNEPLANLYIYTFLSNHNGIFRDFYLNDLKHNDYYNNLSANLKTHYANTRYSQDFDIELASDTYILTKTRKTNYPYWLYLLALLGITALAITFGILKKTKKQTHNIPVQLLQTLTNQEQNIFDLLLKNYSNKAIANALFISVSTVKTHVNNIYRKLEVNSRSELKTLYNNTLKN